MKSKWVLLSLAALLIMGAVAWKFTQSEVKPLEPRPFSIPLGYGRGNAYTPEITLKPDLALLYKYKKPLALNHVGLQGVWFVERDRITSLSDNGLLSLSFQSPKVYVELSGQSSLPIRLELDGKSIGEIWVEGDLVYEITPSEGGPHLLTLHTPRGISAYSFNLTRL